MNFKETGNDLFRKGEWVKAKECYTKALQADPNLTAALANRAACEIQLSEYADALRDCEVAVSQASGALKTKVLWRMAVSLRFLGTDQKRWEEVVAEGLKQDPLNSTLLEEKKHIYVRKLETMPDEYKEAQPNVKPVSAPSPTPNSSTLRLPTLPLTYAKLLTLVRMEPSQTRDFFYQHISGSDLLSALKTAGLEPATLEYMCRLILSAPQEKAKNKEYMQALSKAPRFSTAQFMADEDLFSQAQQCAGYP